jgi:preprotein translocase subunit SecD
VDLKISKCHSEIDQVDQKTERLRNATVEELEKLKVQFVRMYESLRASFANQTQRQSYVQAMHEQHQKQRAEDLKKMEQIVRENIARAMTQVHTEKEQEMGLLIQRVQRVEESLTHAVSSVETRLRSEIPRENLHPISSEAEFASLRAQLDVIRARVLHGEGIFTKASKKPKKNCVICICNSPSFKADMFPKQ